MPVAGRMTLCNMAVEFGAWSAVVAPDAVTFEWLAGRAFAPQGALWDRAVASWRDLRSDDDAASDREVHIDVGAIGPQVTWGTSPQHVAAVTGRGARPARHRRPRAAGGGREGAGLHGPGARTGPWPRCRSTRCSSAPAPTRGWTTCGPPPKCCAGGTSPPGSARRSWCPARARSNARPRPRGSTRCSAPPASNGAKAGVRCASSAAGRRSRPARASPPPPTATSRTGRGPASAPT